MTQEEMKAALQEELKTFKESMSEYISKEDLQNKLKEFEEKIEALDMGDALKELTEAVEKQGLEINKFNSNQPKEVKTIEQLLTENKEALLNAAEKTVTIKTDVTRASVTDHTLALRLTDVGQLATQANILAPLFAQANIGKGMGGVVRYVDQVSVTNNAAAVAEGGVKPESAITWIEKTMPIQKVAHNIPVTMEALDDIGFMTSEINNMLLRYLDIKVDGYLWSGTGTAPQITGIYTASDTYTAAASGIDDASIYDLIVKIRESISAATGYMPNYAVMNLVDINKMKLKKDANNNYIIPPFVSTNGNQVDGITVVASNSVTANTMLMGDFNYATLYKMGGVTLKVGLIDKQFVENMVTVQAEQRLGLLVRSAHTDAFRKVTSISAALTTLAT